MFQPSTTNILPIVNPSITQDFKSTGYNWQKWAKWGLLSAGGLAATAAVIYGGPMIFTGLFSLMTGVAAKLSGDGQGNALAPFEPSNMLMANPVDLALPSPQGGLNKDDWLTEFVGSTSEELPEYLKDTIKEQSADLDEAELAEDTEDYLDGLSNLFNKPFLDEEKTSDDLERDHVLAEPPSAKTDTDITELLLPAVIEKQQATSLKLTEFEELSIDPISKQQSKRSPALFPEVIELSSLTGSTGFKLDGEAADDWSGYSVASAGDINGDNITDLIVGAPDADSIMNAGQSYVVFGHTGAWASPIELSSLTGVTGFKLDGEAVGDYSGYSVASAGDINGDSIDDLIVGAFYAGPSGRGDAGRSYVVFGHTGAWASPIELSSLTGTTGFKLDGEAASDYSGVSVSSAGDINGDSITDLIVGAYYANPSGRIHAGRSYVVFGHTGAWASPIELSSLTGATGFKLDGEAAYDWSGYSVASAGDINGDSITDLIVGAYGADPSLRSTAGRSYVVFGHTGAWTSPIELSSLTGVTGFKLDGEVADDRSGRSVASAGDINGDSITDLIVGAREADPSLRSAAGRSYVVFGHTGAWASPIELSSLTGATGFKLDGEAAADLSGHSVASAGDINGDSITDLIVGAYGADPSLRSTAGRSYVVFGHTGAWASPIELSSLTGATGFKIDGEVGGDYSGWSVASAGDINGDSIDDLIVGANYADPSGRGDAGRSYVVFGRSAQNSSSSTISAPFSSSPPVSSDSTLVSSITSPSSTISAPFSSSPLVSSDSTLVSSITSPSSTISAPFSSSPLVSSDSTLVSSITNPSSLPSTSFSPESSTLPVLSSSNQQQFYSSSNEPVQSRGGMLWLIGLVVGLGAVAGGGVLAGLLVKRYLQNREQELNDIELQSEKLPFRIIRQIGRGGNAEVYEGEWIKAGSWQGKHVAIKKLPDIFKELTEATNEFTKEARFLQQYRHPNLIEFVDFFSVPHWCLVLKYYYRGSLDKVLTDERYLLPWNPERNGFMCGIANGLKFLHENGIIHRDMKPGNVLIDENMTPKITDFGTARIQDTLTMTKGVGTPAYIAPEIITAEDSGKIRYTNSVDVYSYGLILWAIWHRQEPFTQFEQSWQIIKYAVDKQGRPSLEGCPAPSLANLIGRCWAHRAKVRPSMQEVCEELNTVTAELAGA